MRVWLSGPRILGGLLRPGISLGREDLHPRLPSWRRYEPLATGALDSAGDLTFHLKGSREEIIQGILGRSAAWNVPMTRVKAEQLTDRAIRDIGRRKWPGIVFAVLVIVVILIVAVAANARECCQDSSYDSNYRNGGDYQRNGWLHDGAKCFNEWGERGTYFGHHCYRDSDD